MCSCAMYVQSVRLLIITCWKIGTWDKLTQLLIGDVLAGDVGCRQGQVWEGLSQSVSPCSEVSAAHV